MTSRLVMLFALAIAACDVRDPLPPEEPRKPTICAMVANPTEFQGQQATLDAMVTSDGMHVTLLMDRHSPCDRGIVLSWSDAAPPAGSERIGEAIWRPWPGTSNKTIDGRFTGVLRHQDRPDGFFQYVFVVSRIEDLQIAIGQRP